MQRKIQGIIIKDSKILTVEGINENGRRDNFFITGQMKENENEIDAIRRELKEQLNLDHEITFQFSKEIGNGTRTFFIHLHQEDINLDCDLESIKSFNDSYKPVGLKWMELSDRKLFREIEIQYIKLLLEEAIKNDYHAQWVDILRDTYFSSQIGKKYLNNFHREKERSKVDTKAGRENKIIGMSMALGLGVLFSYFFIWDHIGISGFIFSMAIISASIFGNYQEMKLNNKLGFIFLVPIVLLSLSFCIYNDFVLSALNIVLIPFLITSYLITLRYKEIREISVSFIINVLDRVFAKSFNVSSKFFVFSKELTSDRKKLKKNPIYKNVTRGLLISIPLLAVILLLLTSADMMFRHYVENISLLFKEFNIMRVLAHTFVIVAVALYMFGFLWSFKYHEIHEDNKTVNIFKASWEPVTIITILSVINIAYLLFTIVQFSYLYSGGAHALPEGFSYAEYARKGFFELVLVTIINLIILLLSINFTKQDSNRINKIVNISNSTLILFTFNMLISASYKMYLYETAFGFTRLRIFVQVFMVLIGILLVIVLAGIWMQRIPILKYALIATLTVYVGLNFINVDRLIAKENISRYQATGKIDIGYITRLSYDAAPEVIKLLEVEDTHIRFQVENYLNNQKERLNKSYDNWYEYNYYKSQFKKIGQQ